MNNYFKGYYHKLQKDKNTIAFIPGISKDGLFIQIITNQKSYNIPYIGENVFTENGIKININEKDLSLIGQVKYSELTPIRYDIMGVFKYFPMECRHSIISMHHKLNGHLILNDELLDFSNGTGYIESDSGTSFPKTYLWIQCNDFPVKCSIMASIADIPFLGFNFKGCICVINFLGNEYRLATYLGVKILKYTDKEIILKQGKYLLKINILRHKGQNLYAPHSGEMTRIIRESLSCQAVFDFYINDKKLFNFKSDNASFEFVK